MINLGPPDNRCLGGVTYGLTTLAPIRPDVGHVSPRADLARVLAAMPTGADSPLARVAATHLARWVIIATLPFEGPPARPDTLKSAYLLFTANLDGDLDSYAHQLAESIPDTVNEVWGHCIAFPGVADRTAFRDYLRRCQIPTTFVFGAYPSTPLPGVLRAVATQQALARFVAENGGASGADLQRRFVAFRQRLQAMPTPPPGTA